MIPHEWSEDHDAASEDLKAAKIEVQLTSADASDEDWDHFERNLPPVLGYGPPKGAASLNAEGKIKIPEYKLGRFRVYARKVLGRSAIVKSQEELPSTPRSPYIELFTTSSGRVVEIVTEDCFLSLAEEDNKRPKYQRLWNALARDARFRGGSLLREIRTENHKNALTVESLGIAVDMLVRGKYKISYVGKKFGQRVLISLLEKIRPDSEAV